MPESNAADPRSNLESTRAESRRERPVPGQPSDVEVEEERLKALDGDGGGQRTEVGGPYDGKGGVRRGVEKRHHRDEDADSIAESKNDP